MRNLLYATLAATGAALWMLSPVARGDTVVITSEKAAGLYESPDVALANGAGSYVFAGMTDQATGFNVRRALVSFELQTSIPAGATIDSVRLSLYLSRSADSTPKVLEVRRVLTSWTEGASDPLGQEGAGASAEPGDATWVHSSFNNALWDNQWADFARGTSATASIGTTQRYYDWTSVELADDVRSWIVEPASNHGWIVLGDESDFGTAKRFNSDDHPDPTRHPLLTIDYTVVPEPAAVMGLMLCALCFRRCAQSPWQS